MLHSGAVHGASGWRARTCRWAALLVLACVLAGAGASCKKSRQKKAKAQLQSIEGLEAVPRDAQVVLGVNVATLRMSRLVERLVAQMFRRDPGLETRIRMLIQACKLEPAKHLDSFLIGLGKDGTRDEAVLVASGAFVEAELAGCVAKAVEADGSKLATRQVAGRTAYTTPARDGREPIWFAISGPRTLVVATSSVWLGRALSGDGRDAVSTNPAMAELLGRVDHSSGVWAVGLVDTQVGSGLVDLTQGKIAAPPAALFAQGELRAGAKLVLGAIMASESDANSLVSLIKGQLSLAALAAQNKRLGVLMRKLGVDAEGKTVYLRMSLSEVEVDETLAQIDTTTGSPRGSRAD